MLAFTLQPGTIAGWLTLAILVYGLVIFRRGGGGTALSELERANGILDRRVKELNSQASRDQATIEGLRASRDFAQAIAPILSRITEHETTSQETFERIADALDSQTLVLNVIATKLGAEIPAP